jgi:hypothetical protein
MWAGEKPEIVEIVRPVSSAIIIISSPAQRPWPASIPPPRRAPHLLPARGPFSCAESGVNRSEGQVTVPVTRPSCFAPAMSADRRPVPASSARQALHPGSAPLDVAAELLLCSCLPPRAACDSVASCGPVDRRQCFGDGTGHTSDGGDDVGVIGGGAGDEAGDATDEASRLQRTSARAAGRSVHQGGDDARRSGGVGEPRFKASPRRGRRARLGIHDLDR